MNKLMQKFAHKFLSLILLAGTFSNDALVQEQIGVASAVNKNTIDLTLEQERKLIDAGYEIIQNHTIETDDIGRAQMLLLDGTAFSVGPNSSVVLDKFIYNPKTAEGSLEVTARGLLRIVGGKVTKKQPALIRTNSATVGIRGGIGIVQTNGSETNATFLYGTEMTVTPNCVDLDSFGDQCSSDYATTVTEPGFSVSVESEDSEPSEPVEVTEESLAAIQEELEASEEAPEEELGAEETPAKETQEEESTAEETPAGEIQEEEGTSGDQDSGDIEVDEGLLDSSGVSNVSSSVSPEELGTAEEFEVAIELETVKADDANENSTENVAEEVTKSTQETTVEVAPIFIVEAEDVVTSFDENTSEITLAHFAIVNPSEQNYKVIIEGEGSDAFTYNPETNSLVVLQELDYELQESVDLTVTFMTDNGDIQQVTLAIDVTDVDEPVMVSVEPVNTISEAAISSELIANQVNVSETAPAGTVVANFSAIDPEGNALTYSLSGSGSDLMTVSETGEVTLVGDLDFEADSLLEVILEISDGVNITTEEIIINVINDDEPATIAASVSASSFAENTAIGASIASVDANDPEGNSVTFTLAGTGSDNFSIDASGNITLATGLDFETTSSYEITVVADDGTFASTEVITITVADVNEAPTLIASLAFNAFQENTSTGTAIASSSVSDPESNAITFTLSGDGSELFAIDEEGNVTLVGSLDYETTTSYTLTITASDGTNSVSETITFGIDDINESPMLASTLANESIDETTATGTAIASSSVSDPESNAITFTLSGDGSELFAIDEEGNVTLVGSLDYETTTSYTLTITASDGTNSVSETLTFTINDIDLSLTASLVSTSQDENIAAGTTILTASTSDAEGTVTYSITGGDDKFTIDSSTGEVILASALDYETSTSHTFTITASDGTTSLSESYIITINDVYLNNITVTLANNGEPISENQSSGVSTASSSVNNPDNETLTYSLSGSGSENFSIDSSGNITTNAILDFETTKLFNLTVTITGENSSIDKSITINVQNLEEIESGVLRYSGNYSTVSQANFNATSTRDNNSGDLNNYSLDTIVSSEDSSSSSKSVNDYINSSQHSIPVSTITGNGDDSLGVSKHEIKYTLPVNNDRVFAPNEGNATGSIQSQNASESVSSSIADSEVITAGHTSDGDAWFLILNKDTSNVAATYTSEDGSNGLDYSLYQWYSMPSYSLANGATCSGCSLRTTGNIANVNYDWGNGSVLGSISEKVLLKITGKFVVPTTLVSNGEEQIVYFRIVSDDGVAFEIDNTQIITNWTDHAPTANTGSFTGVAGQGYDLELYWYENGGGAVLQMQYRLSTSDSWITIPASAFVIDDTFSTSSTYDVYAAQVMMGGEIFTDIDFYNFTGGASPSKRLVAFAVYPRENVAGQWWHPNFIPSSMFSYSNVAPNYCTALNSSAACDADYNLTYDWMDRALRGTIWEKYFGLTTSYVPEGSSLWWQVFNPAGTGVGLWAQLNFYDTYDGSDNATNRDSQESLLNVVIANLDYRKNMTSIYAPGDTGLGMAGVGYWSYQGDTSASSDGKGIIAGTTPIECATSADSGCIWGSKDTTAYISGKMDNTSTNTPRSAMITSSDPYKSGDMTLAVAYDSNSDSYATGTFDQPIYWQSIYNYADSDYEIDAYKTLSDFRSTNFYLSSSSSYKGFFAGMLEYDVTGSGNGQLAPVRSTTQATFAFDTTNDLLEVSVPLTVSAYSNNYLDTWSSIVQGSLNLTFGDTDNDNAKSAYISSEIFAAELENNAQQIGGSAAEVNSLIGVMVSYNTIQNPDNDLFDSTNAAMPNNSYSTWGFWAMSSADISEATDNQNAGVHLGTWVAGEVISSSDIPTTGTASMSGAAVMNVAYRYNQSGSTYGVKKYTTTADVDVQFNWGSSGYGGNVTFSSFDSHNPIISNAGYSSFIIAINGIDSSYSGGSSFVTSNDWQGLTSLQGLLYGTSSSIESGGSFSLELIKSGDLDTTGANDFYFAEGIYLVN
ncbi:cadherin domain-containing protein [Gammaproteobacteria bacterium]|nr:cadherin domain-containing protein [Gammaproteobacteria bacterium]